MPVTDREIYYSKGYDDGVKDTVIKGVTWLVAVIVAINVSSRLLHKFAK